MCLLSEDLTIGRFTLENKELKGGAGISFSKNFPPP
jgi:hypothetical protein